MQNPIALAFCSTKRASSVVRADAFGKVVMTKTSWSMGDWMLVHLSKASPRRSEQPAAALATLLAVRESMTLHHHARMFEEAANARFFMMSSRAFAPIDVIFSGSVGGGGGRGGVTEWNL